MSLRIVAIADAHYTEGSLDACGVRRTAIADTLLLRAIQRVNRFIKPDLTVILGDLVDDGSRESLEHLKPIIERLATPYIIIPGNHDGDIEQFYSVFSRPAETLDINGVRVVTFIDPEEPGYNARRCKGDIARMDAARSDHDGPIVSLQHVPLLPPNASESPYGYVNASEVWSAFERNDFTLAISGHWHAGDDLVARGAGKAVVVPALCEAPFAFTEIVIDGDSVETHRHELSLPDGLDLCDYHVHTPFAYCSENMNAPLTLKIAREFRLAHLCFTEHSGQLYFDRDTFWGAKFLDDGLDFKEGRQERMADYLAYASQCCPPAYLGLEIDCDNAGNPVVRKEDWDRTRIHIGSMHWLQELKKPEPDLSVAAEEMLGRLPKFLSSGIQVLAHPLRVFRKWPDETPRWLVERMLPMLREHGVAAEINFHVQETFPDFLNLCVENGVKIVFGSDSHNLYEIGEFYPHLELMKRCGYSRSDLPEIMADICPVG